MSTSFCRCFILHVTTVLLTENAIFPNPLLFNSLAGDEPFRFLDEPYITKTRVPMLSVGEDQILACIILT